MTSSNKNFDLSPRFFTYNSGLYFTVYQKIVTEYMQHYGRNMDFLEEKQVYVAFRPKQKLFGFKRTPISYGVDLRYVAIFGLQFGYIHTFLKEEDAESLIEDHDDGLFSLEFEEPF